MQFTQVKLQTSDPERLARFYEEALDCEVLLPLTNLAPGTWRGIGPDETAVSILVMSLPGREDGPTLELITGTGVEGAGGMLTFNVDDVAAAAERVIAAGGSFRGEPTDLTGPGGHVSRFVFMEDPDGNVIDLFQAVD